MDEHLLEVYLINTARHTEETPVAEWVSLPTDAETMKAVFERLGVDGAIRNSIRYLPINPLWTGGAKP